MMHRLYLFQKCSLHFCLFSLLLLMSLNTAVAQTITVQGKITDAADGSALVGAVVIVQGSSQGAMADADGAYTLEADANATLIFSFVGYETQQVAINGRTTVDVTLQPSATSLNEVVVVGFGTQKRVNLSGAVDVIDSKVLESRPIQNVAQGLQGAIPNLNIDFFSGEPGATPAINIRGIGSINGGADPLIIIDNVPMTAADLNYIAPADIKSISVLKDASSAAIYGARAANGVILVTTKSGVKEGFVVDYSNNFSWSKPTVLPNKVTDPYIYMRTLETSTDNTPWDYVNYTAEEYAWARDRSDNPSGTDPVRINPSALAQWQYMGNKDWTRHFLNNYTFSQRQNLSISGKSGQTTYYLSGSYDSQNGALRIAEDIYDRYAFRSKVNYKPFAWLSLGNNTSFALTERNKPYYLSIENIYNIAPTSWDKNPDGTWANSDAGLVSAQLSDGGNITDKSTLFQTTFSGEATVVKNLLRVNSDFSLRRDGRNYNAFQTKYRIGFGPDDVREEGNDNIAYRTAAFTSYYVWNTYATLEKTINKHYGNIIVGYNQEFNSYESIGITRPGVISASLPTVQLATGVPVVSEYIDEWAIRGAFYRLNYIYNDKYILELNGRYDGSSKFPSDKRFVFVPSVSGAWRVDAEDFWRPLIPVVNAFKIRASYGSLVNQSGVSSYGYQETSGSYQSGYLIDGTRPIAISSPDPVSSNYTWEKVETQNLGVDVGLFQQRLSATVDIYNRKTKDMLTFGQELPNVYGAPEPLENAADLETKGWELSLGYNDELTVAGKPLSFNAKFIVADSRTHITRFDNPNGSLTQFYKGKELGEIWGLQNDGTFTSQEEIDALDQTAIVPWGALNIVEGWPRYRDLDGNNVIEKGATVDDPKDLSVIGNVTPRYRYSVNLSAAWSGFDLSVFFQGVGKRDYYPLNYLYWGFYQQPYAGGYEHLLDYYRASDDPAALMAQHSQSYIDAGLANANTDAFYPVLQSWLADRNLGERIDEAQGLAIPQTKYMLNGAYLRLKNLTIGYSLPKGLLERAHIQRLRVYASGENLAEWSKLKKYFDPEAITDNVDKVDPSVSTSSGWGYAYPFQRRYSFGIEIQF